jgi:hypothetical protein
MKKEHCNGKKPRKHINEKIAATVKDSRKKSMKGLIKAEV